MLPPEVELMQQSARLREQLTGDLPPDERRLLNRRLVEPEQFIALRLEAMRVSGSL